MAEARRAAGVGVSARGARGAIRGVGVTKLFLDTRVGGTVNTARGRVSD
jgi:hypothetical protein